MSSTEPRPPVGEGRSEMHAPSAGSLDSMSGDSGSGTLIIDPPASLQPSAATPERRDTVHLISPRRSRRKIPCHPWCLLVISFRMLHLGCSVRSFI